MVRFEAITKQKQPVSFTLTEDDEHEIKDFQVICSVDISKETSNKVTLTKKASIEVSKLLDNIHDTVKEKLNDESDEEAEKQSSEDSEASEKEGPLTKRTFLKAPRKLNQSQANQSAPTKVIKKRPKKDTDSEDEHVDVQEILSKVGKKRAYPFNKTATQPDEKKVKKLTSDGASESIEVPVQKAAKKPAKLPTVFKLGKWNPDTVLIKPEEELEK